MKKLVCLVAALIIAGVGLAGAQEQGKGIDATGSWESTTYAGTVNGDTITGTADFGGMGSGNWTAKRKK
ncbi:MAG: hypothetical protein Q7V01_01455 [Vicinamibacterales bacterium]|nr:hypothetical protein [Vicinamibacterales bacterium]